MRQLWKKLQLGVFAGLALLATGCGGLQGYYSVSPKTFLLPGLMRANPHPIDPNVDLPLNEATRELAQTQNSQINF